MPTNHTRLDAVLARSTVFTSFNELLTTSPGYVPTMDLRAAPGLYAVAVALVGAGRDAYLVTKTGARVFASAVVFTAPEVLKADFGIEPVRPQIKGTIFARGGETWKAVRMGKTTFGSKIYTGVVARRWNRSRSAFNKSTNIVRNVTEDFVFENEISHPKS